MQEIPIESYALARTLVEASGMRGHLALVYELLDGQKTGRVYVDDLARPRTALVCPSTGFYFAFGAPDQAVIQPLVEALWRDQIPLRHREIYVSLFGSNAAWEAPLQRIFAGKRSAPANRLAFDLHGSPPALAIPAGFRLAPIDAALARGILDGSATGNFGIDPWFIRVGGGPETYATRGLGLALMAGDQIASLCGYCALAHGEAEMEVGTVPAFRGRGLAEAVSAGFMRQCQARGIVPAYSCATRNLPSLAVAHKLGYSEIEEVSGYTLYEADPNDLVL